MYSAVTDLERLLAPEQLRQLADDGLGSPEPEVVMAEAIEQADREIDAFLGMVLAVPLEPVPPLVANLSAKIAVYNLFRRRSHLELGEWAGEYSRAVKLLERIARGDLSLGQPAADQVAPPREPNSLAVVAPRRHFHLRDY